MTRRGFLVLTLGSTAWSATEQPQGVVRLGMIADPQYADKDTLRSRHYRQSLEKLRASIAQLNEAAPDAVVTLGDFIDEDFASFTPVLDIYRGLQPPHFAVAGNHDYEVADADKAKVADLLGIRRPGTSKIFGSWRVILLDGTEVSLFRPEHADKAQEMLDRLHREGLPQAQPWNGAIGENQMAWLEKELEEATAARQRVILCCHYPVFPADPHNLWNDREVLALIDRFPCVAAWFNGHNHAGNYAMRGNCHFVNLKGMVETADQAPYAIVSLHADHIEIDGLSSEPDRRCEMPAEKSR